MPWWVGVSILLLFVVLAVRTIRRRANARAIDQLLLEQATRDLDDWESRVQEARRSVSNLSEQVVRFGWDSQSVQHQGWFTHSNELLVNAQRDLAPTAAWQDGRYYRLLEDEITSVRRLVSLLIRRDWDAWTKEASRWYQYKATERNISLRVADRHVFRESFKVKSAKVESALGLAACIALLISLVWAIDGLSPDSQGDDEPKSLAAVPTSDQLPTLASNLKSTSEDDLLSLDDVPTPTSTPDIFGRLRVTPTSTNEATSTFNSDGNEEPTAPVFTETYSTATAEDVGKSPAENAGNCPGYNEYMSKTNARVYRANVLIDLLDQAGSEVNGFDDLDFTTISDEIRALIIWQDQTTPPAPLNAYNDEAVDWLREVRKLIDAAGSTDQTAYRDAIDEYNSFLDQVQIDPKQACGFKD